MKRKILYFFGIVTASVLLIFFLVPIRLQFGKWGCVTQRGFLSPGETYLDGTRHVFQRGSWHMGDGTRLYGFTYGVKIGRFYFTYGTIHGDPIDPLIEPDDASR